MTKHFLIVCMLLAAVTRLDAQDVYSDQVKNYISKYYSLAIEEQKTYGIPACVTLAQGIHESEAGSSDLTTRGNNHFGIKCKSDWKGDTIIHTDNRPDECFKKYNSAGESYRDHSEHLKKNPRYAPLFALSPTDYAGWAIGLRTCGYATNPQYSIRLIKLIEDYHLQQYTYVAIEGNTPKNYPAADMPVAITPAPKPIKKPVETDKTDSLRKVVDSLRMNMMARLAAEKAAKAKEMAAVKPVADTIAKKPAPKPVAVVAPKETPKKEEAEPVAASDIAYDSGKVVMVNGLRAFYANKDEMLLKYAVKYKIRYAKLLELNDLPDAPLPDNMPIYLEHKLMNGTHSARTVKKGETMQLISQLEGVQLKRLYSLNLMEPGQEPVAGTMLELQTPIATRPEVVAAKKKPLPKSEESVAKKQNDNEFVPVSHPKPVVKDTVKDAMVEVVPEVKNTTDNPRKRQTVLKEDTAAEDLSGLKAELDRVVYADNSKLRSAPKPKSVPAEEVDAPAKKAVAKPEPKSAKKGHEKKPVTYVIKRGDTLIGIAEKFHVTVKQLREWNDISGSAIRDGKTLKVQE